MKKIISIIFTITLATTFISCRKSTAYMYAYCDKGHSPWKGTEHESKSGRIFTDAMNNAANNDATAHDTTIHAGVRTAEIRSGYK